MAAESAKLTSAIHSSWRTLALTRVIPSTKSVSHRAIPEMIQNA